MGLLDAFSSLLNRILSRSGDYRLRYGKEYGSNSVDYRAHRRILATGQVPPKFRVLADIVPGQSIVDVGAGEGILALELASRGRRARAIDVTPRRHRTGLDLQARWAALGKPVQDCEMVLGDALTDPSLLAGFDTIVCSRVIYYFGDRIDEFVANAARLVPHICLVGNDSRNRRYAKGIVPGDIGDNIIYSTPEGMRTLLERHGFEIMQTGLVDKDPFVIGKRAGT